MKMNVILMNNGLLAVFLSLGLLHNASSSLLGGLEGHHHGHDQNHGHNHGHNHENVHHAQHQEEHSPHLHSDNHHDHKEMNTELHVHSNHEPDVDKTESPSNESDQKLRGSSVKQQKNTNQSNEKRNGGSQDSGRRPKNFGSSPSFSLRIPKTDFSCKERAPGYYADMATECQVYYMCQGRGGGRPFLCPEGTKFNQRTFVCDHAARVKCSEASNFFHRNLIIQQESNTPRNDDIRRLDQLQKRPRVETSPIFNIKLETSIPSRANGRMAFAPLFEEDRQRNVEKFFKMVTHHNDHPVARPEAQRASNKENMDASMLLGLPELPPQSQDTSSRSPEAIEDVNEVDDYDDYDENGKLQLLPKKQASKSVARFHKDREQPELRLIPPPVASLQLVGHTMDREDIKFIPNSPVFNISFTTDAQMKTLPLNIDNLFSQADGGRHGKSGDQSLNLPLHLVPPKPAHQSPLVWISPASLARSPMVLLRRLSTQQTDPNVPLERSLTMNFPARSSRRFDPQCLACFQDGSNCPRNCIAP